MTKTADWYARAYTANFGLHIVPIEPGRKYPKTDDWGNNALAEPDAASQFFHDRPTWNMGVALGPSRMCSLDVDYLAGVKLICETFGIDFEDLIARNPTIKGRGLRIMFRVPEGVSLPYHKLNWPSPNDPTGDKHKAAMAAAASAKQAGDTQREQRIRRVAKRWAIITVMELRASGDGKQRQDVLPPSIHPDTKQPYVWVSQPRSPWPEPPAWLLTMWTEWERFKPQLKAVCPWSIDPEVPERKIKAKQAVYTPGVSIIDAWIQSNPIESALERYGYQPRGKRYLSPHSGTGLPGVHIFKDGRACWIHHASDPLCSVDSGHPVNSFDLFCYYDHGGDVVKAVKAAADALGIKPSAVRYNPQPEHSTITDAKTGEVLQNFDSGGIEFTTSPTGRGDISTPLPWVTGNGKPMNHIENLIEIARRLNITIRYNVIRKEEEILIPNMSFTRDNEANASLAWLTSECSVFNFPVSKIGEWITWIADRNLFNPVRTWISSKPWDGVDRLGDYFGSIKAVGESDNPKIMHLKQVLMLRWAVAAVAAGVSEDGVSAAGVLVLQGNQYLGKTKWFKSLVPRELDLIKDGMLLRPDDKDSVKQCVSYWLVELGELDATFRRSDIAALKSFLTNDRDVIRRAYARRESTYARRTVFFGSVNPREYLHDPTGNRRYWTIECESINADHGIDMQQFWAQILALHEEGESYYLTPDEMAALNDHNTDFTAIDPVEEKAETLLNWDAPESTWQWRTATDIAAMIHLERLTKSEINSVASYVRKRNGGRARRSADGRFLFCPPVLIPWSS